MRRKIEFLRWEDGRLASYDPPQIGDFHQWGQAGETGLDGGEYYPVAIIEMPDGSIETPAAGSCRFVPEPEPILPETFTLRPGATRLMEDPVLSLSGLRDRVKNSDLSDLAEVARIHKELEEYLAQKREPESEECEHDFGEPYLCPDSRLKVVKCCKCGFEGID